DQEGAHCRPRAAEGAERLRPEQASAAQEAGGGARALQEGERRHVRGEAGRRATDGADEEGGVTAPARLLVVRRGGLGDTLLMTAALRALRRVHPGAQLHFAGVRELAAVLAHHGVADRVLSSEDLAAWRAGPSPRLAGYGLVIADDPAFATAAGPGVRVQTFDPRPRDDRPMGLQLASMLGLQPRWPDDAWLRPPHTAGDGGPLVLAPGR